MVWAHDAVARAQLQPQLEIYRRRAGIGDIHPDGMRLRPRRAGRRFLHRRHLNVGSIAQIDFNLFVDRQVSNVCLVQQ